MPQAYFYSVFNKRLFQSFKVIVPFIYLFIYSIITSFRCECDEGYITADNETRCADIDECAVNNGGCSQNCVNMDGSYMCECSEGYNATDPE